MNQPSHHDKRSPVAGTSLLADLIWQITTDSQLRWGDVLQGDLLAEQCILLPDPYLSDLTAHVVRDQQGKALVANDPFHGVYGPPGSLPPLQPGRIPLVLLPNTDCVSLDIRELTLHCVCCGAVGVGKSNFARIVIASILRAIS